MLKPGDKAPDFELNCAENGQLGKAGLSKNASELTVLFFYPRDFSFICPTEVIGFNSKLTEFQHESTRIIGMSVDDAACHLRWAKELGGIGYPLVEDPGGATAEAYGVFDEGAGVSLRATFVINRNLEILYSVASANNVGRSVAETLRVIQALRTGRLCPSDWTPGTEFGPADQEY